MKMLVLLMIANTISWSIIAMKIIGIIELPWWAVIPIAAVVGNGIAIAMMYVVGGDDNE